MEFGVYSMEKLVCILKKLYSSPLSKYMEFGVYSIEKIILESPILLPGIWRLLDGKTCAYIEKIRHESSI